MSLVPWTRFCPGVRLPRPTFRIGRRLSTSNMQNSKPSIGRRTSRAFARYSIVFLIGIGATLAWQSYSDEAMEMVRTEAPSLAWLLPVSTAKPPPDDQGSTAAAASSPQLERLELSLARRAAQRRAARCHGRAALRQARPTGRQARPDVPHCDIEVGRTPTSVPGSPPAQTPATHCAVVGHAVIISACAAASYWTILALMALLSDQTPATSRGFSFGGE